MIQSSPSAATTELDDWRRAVATLTDEYQRLPVELLARCRHWTGEILRLKREMSQFHLAVAGDRVCSQCAGACCASGRYHVTVVDILVCLDVRRDLPDPHYQTGKCPHLGAAGCSIEPELRPFTCCVFLCDAIEERMAAETLRQLTRLEKEMRAAYAALERMFANRFMCGLLINYQRDVLDKGGTMLRVTLQQPVTGGAAATSHL